MVTLVEGDPKASFSIATPRRCRGGRYSFPWIAPFYAWSLPYKADCYTRWHQVPFFESLVWLDLRLNSSLPGHWRTLYSLDQWPGNNMKYFFLQIFMETYKKIIIFYWKVYQSLIKSLILVYFENLSLRISLLYNPEVMIPPKI